MAKIAEPRGARNTADHPAAMPVITNIRISDRLRWSLVPTNDAIPPEIWEIGPSFPELPPLPIVNAEATIFTGTILALTFPP